MPTGIANARAPPSRKRFAIVLSSWSRDSKVETDKMMLEKTIILVESSAYTNNIGLDLRPL
jgi:hypothetical protein